MSTDSTGWGIGKAIKEMQNGERVARAGWNGKGMWLMLVPAECWSTSVGPGMAAVPNAHRLPWIAMKTADDGLVPWLASQTDLLATDWMIAG
jgi:hypothetical protein